MNGVLHCAASEAGSILHCSDADEQLVDCRRGGSCVVMMVDGHRKPSCRSVIVLPLISAVSSDWLCWSWS